MAYTNEASAIVKTPTVQSILENFDPLISRLETLVSRASNSADRIAGSRPREASNSKDTPESSHLIWALQARHDRLLRAINCAEDEIQRIENGLA